MCVLFCSVLFFMLVSTPKVLHVTSHILFLGPPTTERKTDLSLLLLYLLSTNLRIACNSYNSFYFGVLWFKMREKRWIYVTIECMNAFVRLLVGFLDIDHFDMNCNDLDIRFASRQNLKNSVVMAGKWSSTNLQGFLHFTTNIEMTTRTFEKNFDPFDEPNGVIPFTT